MSESQSVIDIVTAVGVIIPLLTIAGSGVAFLVKYFADARAKRNARFFELMAHIDNPDRPLAAKLAAVYQLRAFPEHKEFIVRFYDGVSENIDGPSAEVLRREFNETANVFR